MANNRKPKAIRLSLNWQQQYYIEQLLVAGIFGDSVEDVVQRLMCAAMNKYMRDGVIEPVRKDTPNGH